MKTTKEAVIKTTSDLADEKGLNNVSLKAVAQKLNIRTPSLYNHIEIKAFCSLETDNLFGSTGQAESVHHLSVLQDS